MQTELRNEDKKGGFPLGSKGVILTGFKAFLSELQPHNPIMFGTVTWQPLGP